MADPTDVVERLAMYLGGYMDDYTVTPRLADHWRITTYRDPENVAQLRATAARILGVEVTDAEA